MGPVVQQAVGTPNGVLVDFQTPTGFVAGSLRVWENGRLLQAELDNGFLEHASPDFEMKLPPATGSNLLVEYREP